MSRESASEAIRQIRTLHALGAVGGLSDSELVEQFLESSGAGREDAFAALVHRHGPMVLGICRRMLQGSADVDDAFQAVFLVLARKAGAVRRAERLKSWLYGVAVRTAKESRRRSSSRQRREGGTMDESRAISEPDPGKSELAALLDEEINRLPGRYREAVLLCELEGASRQDAARQLGLPEGTLSSRLARGRTLLRDRLTRRGVVLGAGAVGTVLSEPASAALPEALAQSTVQFALEFAAGGAAAGTVPVAISSLARGVLAMTTLARLKSILITAVVLGSGAGLTAGLTSVLASKGGGEPHLTPSLAVESELTKAAPEAGDSIGLVVHGVVVDEAGRPVEMAEVQADAFTTRPAAPVVTNPDGSFTIAVVRKRVDGLPLLAGLGGSDRLGFFQYGYNLSREAARAPARIVLKTGREVTVRVADSNNAPVADAVVQAAGNFAIFDYRKTGRDGSATLHVPADAKVEWIYALKQGKGFDYAEYGRIDEAGRAQGGAEATSLPRSVGLKLDGVRTARIKAVDSAGKPLEGERFTVWLIHKEPRRSQINVSSQVLTAATGHDGVATFDWLPPSKDVLQFWPVDDVYAHRRVTVEEGRTEPVTVKLTCTESIRGRVVRPDGSPAPGIEVRAYGSGKGMDNGQASSRTASDGTYVLAVSPEEAYAVYVDDKEWAAPSRLDVVVRHGKPAERVDFKLTRGTILRGTVTVGPGNQPVPNQFIRVDETGAEAPEEFREPGDHFGHQVRRQFGDMTDSAGHYSIRLGPGTYTLMGPPRTGDEKITIIYEAEVVRNFRMPRPEKGTLTGRVVLAGSGETGVAGARVEIAAANMLAIPFAVSADADGRFRAERELDPLVICAKSPDGALGAMIELGAEKSDVKIALTPTATASGLLLDEQGKPALNQKLYWGRRVYLDEERRVSMECFAPQVVTDGQGKFTLPSLVLGQEYEIAVQRDNMYPAAGAVRPDTAGPIDLGTLKVGAYKGKPGAEEMSSFRKNAPGPGADAAEFNAIALDGKPLKLADFKGRYVLLDFWATWCGPCIREIPNLQAIHEEFGQDERFAIVSLSVDEKIEEPRKFQDKRKLPWKQAFLGVGIQSPIPASYGVVAIPAFVLVGPDGKIIDRGMRGEDIRKAVAKALSTAH